MRLTDTISEAVSSLMREAAERFILPRYRTLNGAEIAEKAAKNFVTVADCQAEAFLLRHFGELVPGGLAIGEESIDCEPALAGRLADDLVWLVDPLDGTRNFVEGRPDFAVMVTLLEKGEAAAAWIYFPMSGTWIETRAGAGTAVDGRSVRCAADPVPARLRGAIVRAGTPLACVNRFHTHRDELAGLCEERFSAAAECLAILTGKLDFGFYWRTLPWDHAPCCLTIREAGGACSRLDGHAFRIDDAKSGLISARNEAVRERLTRWLVE